jgi:hypothetical protein
MARFAWVSSILLLAGSLHAEPPRANETLAKLETATWKKIGEFAPAPSGILAYSGGVFDVTTGNFLIFGGGHADYWGNEVCAFSTGTLTWKKMYEPDARARYTNDNIDNLRGKLKDSDKPYTRHSYNQICSVDEGGQGGRMFIFSGAGPGWEGIKPSVPAPSDCWAYSAKENKWELLYAGPDTPHGFGFACCYDEKRGVVWAYAGGGKLSKFDLKEKKWSSKAIAGDVAFLGTYNFHMKYLPKSDRVLIVGSATCTVDLETLKFEKHELKDGGGKAGLAYLPEQDVVLYTSLPGEGLKFRMAAFDCGEKKWREIESATRPKADGVLWSRLHYDPVNKAAILVGYDGVWAWKPPAKFEWQTK